MRKALFAGAVAVATILGVGIAPAMAATGSTYFASCAKNDGGACAGYVDTGTNFRFVHAATFLRDPSQFSAITNGVGTQVGLKSKTTGNTWDAIMGVSDTTTTGTSYSPQSLVYHNGSILAVGPNAVFCPGGVNCSSTIGSFAVGDTVTQSVFYNQASGIVSFQALASNGDLYKAFFPVGIGVMFGQARVEQGFGTFSHPAANTELFQNKSAGVTTYSGGHFTLTGKFTTHPEKATSTGTGAGTLQAFPNALSPKGAQFKVFFQHV
jgi:hypothetical protein